MLNDELEPKENLKTQPSEELLEAISEIDEMINNKQKYPRFNNREDLKESLLSDD